MTKKITRNIIQDEPTKKDLFHGGGHERTAYSLSKAIVKFDKGDSAIGLDGTWGSGKSSVVEMAARKLAEKNGSGKKSYYFFTFDIWKSQGSGFRRSYLEHFIKWAKRTFPKKQSKLAKIENQIQGKTREIETNNQPILDWYGIAVLVFLPFLPVFYFWAKKTFDDLSREGKTTEFLLSAPFGILLGFVTVTLAIALWKYKCGSDRNRFDDFKSAISRLLLISSRQHQDNKVIQKVREIDPNDYEFHATLREILATVQTDKDRVVVVLDNIDRLPRREIKEYWALVRSIFSRTHGEEIQDKNVDITAIVPYDRKLIDANVNENDDEEITPKSELSSLASRELFSKTFDEVLTVAPPVLSNAREFFADKLEEALPDQVSTDDRFRTYRIFCELLNIEGGTTTPRQIVSFVNDLSSLYELQDGRFALPTVAAFLAHQDRLTDNPSILNEENGLNPKIKTLAADAKLTENLAAMVFNVEEDLAFQILLDDEIASAAISDETNTLVTLSSAPGFDLRVDDVIQSNIEEWGSTGELSLAIGNISELLKSYTGDAKASLADAMLTNFRRVESISVKNNHFAPYFPIFSIADEQALPSTVSHFIKAVFESIRQQETHNYQNGQDLAEFLHSIQIALADVDKKKSLVEALKKQVTPSTPEYMFGLAANVANSGFNLHAFKSTNINFPEDSEYFEEQFVQNPVVAIDAIKQFNQRNLLPDDKMISIANACLSYLTNEEEEDGDEGNLLEIATMLWQKISDERRPDIKLDDALTKGNFFRNVGTGKIDTSEVAQANLLFLLQNRLGETLPNPTILHPNGSRTDDTSNAFEAFKKLLEGSETLTTTQLEIVADKAITARKASIWVNYGKDNENHEAVAQVVHQMFTRAIPPFFNLSTLLSHFGHIKGVVPQESLTDVLQIYAGRMNEADISKLTLDELPNNFLLATNLVGEGHWVSLHSKIESLLVAVEQGAWSNHIETMDQTARVLIEKLQSSGCELDGGQFRKPYIEVVKKVLSGEIEINASNGELDTLLSAIDPKYQEDMWRSLREAISGVTASSLENATKLCPQLIGNVAQQGDRIMKIEKDNVIRHLLIPALEGRNPEILGIFVEMGYNKLKDFQSAAHESTKGMLEAAWEGFSKAGIDQDLKRSVSEVLFGKRRTKSFFDLSSWLPSTD